MDNHLTYSKLKTELIIDGLGLWCLAPCSTIFQLYRGNQFYKSIGEENWNTRRKPLTCHMSLIIELNHF
jgi:hypothetical protein